MHENHVGVAAARGVERLAGTLGDDFNDDAGLLLEQRQDVAEQAGILRRRGGGGPQWIYPAPKRARSAQGQRQSQTRDFASGEPSLSGPLEYSQLSRARCRQANTY